jgi:hypothetical protein
VDAAESHVGSRPNFLISLPCVAWFIEPSLARTDSKRPLSFNSLCFPNG